MKAFEDSDDESNQPEREVAQIETEVIASATEENDDPNAIPTDGLLPPTQFGTSVAYEPFEMSQRKDSEDIFSTQPCELNFVE